MVNIYVNYPFWYKERRFRCERVNTQNQSLSLLIDAIVEVLSV